MERSKVVRVLRFHRIELYHPRSVACSVYQPHVLLTINGQQRNGQSVVRKPLTHN